MPRSFAQSSPFYCMHRTWEPRNLSEKEIRISTKLFRRPIIIAEKRSSEKIILISSFPEWTDASFARTNVNMKKGILQRCSKHWEETPMGESNIRRDFFPPANFHTQLLVKLCHVDILWRGRERERENVRRRLLLCWHQFPDLISISNLTHRFSSQF